MLQTPDAIGPEHLNKKKLFDKWFDSFYFSTVGFILRSFLFTHIDIVTLRTKKDFLHRAILFLFMRHKAAFLLQQMSQSTLYRKQVKAKWPRAMLPPVIAFCFDHFTVQNQIKPE